MQPGLCIAGRCTTLFVARSSLTSRAVPLQDSRGDEAQLKEAVAKHGLQVLAGPGFFETGEPCSRLNTVALHTSPSDTAIFTCNVPEEPCKFVALAEQPGAARALCVRFQDQGWGCA